MTNTITMPFSQSLEKYIKNNPGFRASLKLYNPNRFIPLHTIFLSKIIEFPTDEIIGIFYCDEINVKRNKHPFFKQDFIVNHGNGRFTCYTSIKTQPKDIKHINDFFRKYGMGKYYGTEKGKGDHHYKNTSDLDPLLQSEAKSILEKIKKVL